MMDDILFYFDITDMLKVYPSHTKFCNMLLLSLIALCGGIYDTRYIVEQKLSYLKPFFPFKGSALCF